ncbi:SCO family protein [Nocardioides sp. Kera G14]|uniref:SCO family protein n=1 Tax=Nocardioides sp. Kera G14 TaxID=2884264 RepID=UPI001D0FCDFF|nr:SCO family protein [Nocardioides sp. Kera G14]UDY22442.1 SCO family protein [Nocardioides sp. Kera G14]
MFGVARRLVAVVAALLLLGACGSAGPTGFTGITHAPYAVAATPLQNTDGSTYALTQATKPLTLVFFGYTHCEDYCPLVMNNLSVALQRLDEEDRSKVDLVFVTSDPARDTGPVLRKYLDRYGDGFLGLTGKLTDIVTVAKSLAVSVDDGTKLPDGGYDLTSHSTTITALGPDHTSTVLWDMETSSAQFAADFTAILHGKAPAAS